MPSSRKSKIFFLHVPKCGGTSLDNAFKRTFRNKHIFRLLAPPSAKAADVFFAGDEDVSREQYYHVLRLREALLCYAMALPEIRYVSGHFAYSSAAHDAFGEEYAFVTVLRDPVGRWFSHYFYDRYKDRPEQHNVTDLSLDEMIASERGRSWGTEMVKYYGGLRPDGDYRSREAIEAAIANLRRFDIVGNLADLDGFHADVKNKLGVRLLTFKSNKSPISAEDKKALVTPEIRAAVEEICAPDREVVDALLGTG